MLLHSKTAMSFVVFVNKIHENTSFLPISRLDPPLRTVSKKIAEIRRRENEGGGYVCVTRARARSFFFFLSRG